ncbi:hypothetical protein CAEBREN_06929 [Caenorhabditis brenneri]|uniref:Nuclear receptor domain-containing protein n=1 Tax=Caenorhabditis brenneri TaxID=135651 RepID=G0NMU7_CAEBE|nr:hypothetical protein CAEBREN_06929 [Caenorhabditis brenneri]
MNKEMLCAVCSSRAAGFNYGAATCNACKMFFRRVHVRNEVEECKFQNGNCLAYCTFCRFVQCLQAGMVFHPVVNTYDFRNNEIVLSTIVKNLIYMDNHRTKLFNNFYVEEKDPSFQELLVPITFNEKPREHKMEYAEWGFMSTITSIDFLKKLHFMNDLNAEDAIIVLRHIFIQMNIFSLAYNSYETKRNTLMFPDGTEIPEPNVIGVSEVLVCIYCFLH